MEICPRAGFAHPDHLLATLTWDQVLDWVAQFETDPWDETRADLRQAVLVSWLPPPAEDSPPPFRLTWPYDGEQTEIDVAASLDYLAAHAVRFPQFQEAA